MTFTGKNSDNPYKISCENIVYCMFGGMSEFPEILGIPIGDYYGRGLAGTSNSENIGIKLYQLKFLLVSLKRINWMANNGYVLI